MLRRLAPGRHAPWPSARTTSEALTSWARISRSPFMRIAPHGGVGADKEVWKRRGFRSALFPIGEKGFACEERSLKGNWLSLEHRLRQRLSSLSNQAWAAPIIPPAHRLGGLYHSLCAGYGRIIRAKRVLRLCVEGGSLRPLCSSAMSAMEQADLWKQGRPAGCYYAVRSSCLDHSSVC
jgi:hypothetical protein